MKYDDSTRNFDLNSKNKGAVIEKNHFDVDIGQIKEKIHQNV